MKILLYHKTKDSDLKQGLKVCYKDITGEFSRPAIITDVYEQDGVKVYHLFNTTGAFVADELKLIAPDQLNSVKVHFADSKHDYETSVSSHTTEKTANEYFTGAVFNVGAYPKETMLKCIGITFTDNNL